MLLSGWPNILISYGNIPQCLKVGTKKKAKGLAHKYPTDLNDGDFAAEMQHLPLEHKANFRQPELKPLELENLLTDYTLCEIFPNVCVSLRILLTIPATVASAERSFSKLKLFKIV